MGKKIISFLIIIVMSCFLFSCDDELDSISEISKEQIVTLFEGKGYVIDDQSEQGVTVLVIYYEDEIIQIIMYSNTIFAVEAKTEYDTIASSYNQTCKRVLNIIYYGTKESMKLFEGLLDKTIEEESDDISNLKVNDIKTAFTDSGYTINDQSAAGITVLIANKGLDMIQIIIFPSVLLATESIEIYEIAANTLGQTCKRSKNIIYYGTSSAINIFEGLM